MQSNIQNKSVLPEKPMFSPAHIIERLNLFNQILQKQHQSLQDAQKQEIQVQVKGKGVYQGFSWQLRPIDVLNQIKEKYPDEIIAAKVFYSNSSPKEIEMDKLKQKEDEHQLYDLHRPLEASCSIEFLSFKDPAGQKIFWHSSAHILGAILEQEYSGYLCSGPPVEEGFYYDIYIGGQKINPSHFEGLEQKINKFIQEGHSFQRIVLSKAEALEMFKHNPIKIDIINNRVPENGIISAYSCGSFIDLCKGPHIPSVSYVKAFKVMNAASAAWSGQLGKEEVERVYGVSFPSKAELKEFVEWQKKIANSDHRNIGKQQDLFFFHASSPSAGFYYPYGARLYNKLIELVRKEYRIRGYQEVISPIMFNKNLWECSGHSHSFNKNMFQIKVEDQDFSLKPMNCPGHCIMFGSKLHSYRDLPMRLADFGILHRNEVSGSLQGLLRVRKFQQDDSHIFCRVDQIMDEVMNVLKFMEYIYGLFGLEYKMILATKPDNALGDAELWNKAEKMLSEALEKFGKPWEIAPGEGAFYGPKIEVHLKDIRKRYFQCATMQLDFVLPERFDLKYRVADKDDEEEKEGVGQKEGNKDQSQSQESSLLKSRFERPVMIHRAIMGSIERFLAVLIEKCQGLWPFWLSPKQVKVIPVSDRVVEYAERVYCRLKLEGYDVEMDSSKSNVKLGKKVREAHLEKFNYAIIIGEQEAEKEMISIRDLYQQKDLGKMSIVEVLNFFKSVGIPASEVEIAMKKKALFSKEEKLPVQKLMELDEDLKFKVLFEDDQKEPGQKDRAIYEEIKGYDVNKENMPNLYRWSQFMRKFVQA